MCFCDSPLHKVLMIERGRDLKTTNWMKSTSHSAAFASVERRWGAK